MGKLFDANVVTDDQRGCSMTIRNNRFDAGSLADHSSVTDRDKSRISKQQRFDQYRSFAKVPKDFSVVKPTFESADHRADSVKLFVVGHTEKAAKPGF